MSPTDKKDYALVTQKMRPRLRRTLNTHHYALPKPYRRKRMPEERPRWRRKLGFYVVSGLMIGTLIGQIADMAEEARRERELPIVAAVADEGQAEPASLPASLPNSLPARTAEQDGAAKDVPASPPAPSPAPAPTPAPTPAHAEVGQPPGVSAPALEGLPARAARAASSAAGPASRRGKPAPAASREAARPDPDVVLISAILLLGPALLGEPEPAAAECPADAPQEAGCAELHGMLP